jgi:hypothetical protein
MIKTFTGDISTSETTAIAIVGISMFNKSTEQAVATAYIQDYQGIERSQLMEMTLEPKETVFLNTKIFLSNGDKFIIDGVDFTIAADESQVQQ